MHMLLTRECFWKVWIPTWMISRQYEDHVEALQLERFELPALPSRIIDMRASPAHTHQLRSGRRYRPAGDRALLRSALVQHFHYQYNIGDLQWPRNMSNDIERVLRFGTIDRRAQDQLLLALYVQPSSLVDRYGNPIGDGLFSNIGYTRSDLICYFVGEWISSDTAEERQAAGFGGYMIEYTGQEVLDCYSSTRA